MSLTWDEVVALAQDAWPGLEVATSYGTPALKLRGSLVTRLRPDDLSLVILEVPVEEREMLIEADPGRFHSTPHYEAHAIVLLRLQRADRATVRDLLERRVRAVSQGSRRRGRSGTSDA